MITYKKKEIVCYYKNDFINYSVPELLHGTFLKDKKLEQKNFIAHNILENNLIYAHILSILAKELYIQNKLWNENLLTKKIKEAKDLINRDLCLLQSKPYKKLFGKNIFVTISLTKKSIKTIFKSNRCETLSKVFVTNIGFIFLVGGLLKPSQVKAGNITGLLGNVGIQQIVNTNVKRNLYNNPHVSGLLKNPSMNSFLTETYQIPSAPRVTAQMLTAKKIPATESAFESLCRVASINSTLHTRLIPHRKGPVDFTHQLVAGLYSEAPISRTAANVQAIDSWVRWKKTYYKDNPISLNFTKKIFNFPISDRCVNQMNNIPYKPINLATSVDELVIAGKLNSTFKGTFDWMAQDSPVEHYKNVMFQTTLKKMKGNSNFDYTVNIPSLNGNLVIPADMKRKISAGITNQNHVLCWDTEQQTLLWVIRAHFATEHKIMYLLHYGRKLLSNVDSRRLQDMAAYLRNNVAELDKTCDSIAFLNKWNNLIVEFYSNIEKFGFQFNFSSFICFDTDLNIPTEFREEFSTVFKGYYSPDSELANLVRQSVPQGSMIMHPGDSALAKKFWPAIMTYNWNWKSFTPQ